jgi:ABC-type nitrate/sulfonate/bicarbonate transport system permease component
MMLALGFAVGALVGFVLGVFIGFSLFKRAGTWD